MYSQTWANDHLRIVTTCLQRPLFWGPNYIFYNINDLQTTTTCQQRPLFLGPEGGRCTQVWLYIYFLILNNKQFLINITLEKKHLNNYFDIVLSPFFIEDVILLIR